MLMLLCCGFAILWKLSLAVLIGIILHWSVNKQELPRKLVAWITSLLCSLLLISYLGVHGGINKIVFPMDLVILAPLSYFLLKFSQMTAFEHNKEVVQSHIQLQLE